MMRLKIYLPVYTVILAILALLLTKQEFWAFSAGDYNQKELTAAGYLATDGEGVAMDYIRRCNQTQPGSIRQEAIEHYLDKGYLTGYVEELRQSGYISSGYTLNADSSTPPAGEETSKEKKEPEPFTIEAFDPEKIMWASQEVNYRDGASVAYNKLGSLQKHEAVTVTGKASTGWYQILLADGVTAYVSDRYLTEEDPVSRTVFRYNEEDQVVETIKVEGEDPEIVDQAVEQLTAIPLAEPEAAVKPKVQHTEPKKAVLPEPVPLTEKEPHDYFNTWYLIGAAGSVIVLYIALIMIVKKRKTKL